MPELSEKLQSIDAEELPSISSPVKQFVAALERLESADNVNDLVSDGVLKTLEHSRAMMSREIAYGNIDKDDAASSIEAIEVRYALLESS